MDRLSSTGGHGFIVSWARLVLVLTVVAALSSIFTALLLGHLVADKVSQGDQTHAFRQGCKRNVGTVRDFSRIAEAEITYKSSVLGAASVKSDVKTAATKALAAYTAALPNLQARIIDCELAFPDHGTPRIVRIK